MSAGWKILWLAVATFACSFGAARWLVPDVVPAGLLTKKPQDSWAVLTPFCARDSNWSPHGWPRYALAGDVRGMGAASGRVKPLS